jgi:hypothetical protein
VNGYQNLNHSTRLGGTSVVRNREFSVLIGAAKSAFLKPAIYFKNGTNSNLALWFMCKVLTIVVG